MYRDRVNDHLSITGGLRRSYRLAYIAAIQRGNGLAGLAGRANPGEAAFYPWNWKRIKCIGRMPLTRTANMHYKITDVVD